MTLQLAVRITGDASDLTKSVGEADAAVSHLGDTVQATGAKSTTAAKGIKEAADAAGAAARTGATGAVSTPGRAPGADPAVAPPMPTPNPGGGSPSPRPQVVPPAPAPSIPPLPQGRPTPQGGLRRDQWTNLGYQANDVVTSLASGISPMQVVAQQGGQIVQVLGDAEGGIAGGLKAVASRAASILTPIRLVAGGFIGLGATVAALGVSWSRSQDAIEQGLTGIGAKSRATVADINAIGAVSAAGGRVSSREGRGVATQIAAAGNIDVSNIQGVANLAPGYAKMFGKSIDEAGADLARIFSDPVKGAAELDARIGGLDASTKSYIKTLVDQGNRQEAIRVTARAFASDLEKAAQKTGVLAAAWNKLSTIADTVGKTVAAPFRDNTAEEDLVAAQREQRRTEALYGRSTAGKNGARVRAAQDATSTAQQRVWDEQAAPGIKAGAERSQQYQSAVLAVRPEIEATETLTNRLELLKKAQGDLDALSGMSASARQGLVGAIEATKGAIETNISAEERARKSQELTIRSIEARTAAERAAIAEEQKRLELAGQAISADQRRMAIEGARAAVMAQSTRESQDRLRASGATATAAGLPSYQRRLAELDARSAETDKAAEGNLPAVANNQKAKALERQAIDVEAIGGPLREADRALREQVAGLKLQEAAFGASTEAAAKAAADQQLVNQYTADGVPITENLRKLIDSYAGSLGKVAAEQEALLRKQREIVGGLDDIRGSARSGLTGIFSDLSKGKSPVDGIVSSLDSMSSRIFDRTVSAPLVNNLLGQDGKAGGGLFGDAVSSIFGKATDVSTAQINAGVVNLNGAIAGLAGAGTSSSGAAGAVAALTGKGGGSTEAASDIVSKLSGSRAEVADYVKQAAVARGIDPSVALRVVNQESGFNVAAKNLTAKEQSYGVMQLNTMGGLGSEALKAGVDVRNPDAWRSQVDYGMDVVKKDGWRQWYGARDIGVSRWEGIGGAAPAGATAAVASPSAPAAAAMPQLQNLDASLQSFSTSTTTAQQSLSGLTGNLTALPGPLSQTSAGLSQVGNSLGSSGGGGGLLGTLASLFGGGSGAGASAPTPAVTAATGGHIRGPGTSTSDSINARLSDGEFVVNAKATSQNLPLLHAINDNRLPAYAEGGLHGAAAPPAVAYQAERTRRGEPAMPAPTAGTGLEVNISGAGAPKSQKRSRGSDGRERLDLVFGSMNAAEIGTPGSATSKALEENYGLRRQLVRR